MGWLVAGALASPGARHLHGRAAVLTGGRTADQRCRVAWEEGLAGKYTEAGEWLRPDSAVDAITVAGSSDATGIDKLCQDFGDVAAAHAGGVAQLAL